MTISGLLCSHLVNVFYLRIPPDFYSFIRIVRLYWMSGLLCIFLDNILVDHIVNFVVPQR